MKRILTVIAAASLLAAACQPTINPGPTPGTSDDPATVSEDPSVNPSEEPSAEMVVYTFSQKKLELIESVTATITLSGQVSGKDFKAQEDISLPFTVEGDAAIAVKSEATAFVVKAGTNTASVTFTLDVEKAEELASENAIVKIERPEGILPGDIAQLRLKVHSGIQTPSALVGKWEFDHIYDLDELVYWFEEMGDDASLLPVSNGDYLLVFTEDEETGEVTLKPEGNADFGAFFREAIVTLTSPVGLGSDDEVLGKYTAKCNNMYMADEDDSNVNMIFTFYKLSVANRAFDVESESLGEAVISIRFDEEGDLQLILRDYDTPPFGEMWWEDGKFDPEMFGFAALFTKVTEE